MMIFTILLIISGVMFFGGLLSIALFMIFAQKINDDVGELMFGMGGFGVAFSFVPFVFVGLTWSQYAGTLSKAYAQDQVIQVQESRIASLNERLAEFDYPDGSLLNADTPVASIVESLTDAENAYEEEAKQKQCGAIGCTNQATHTWSGHPTCDDCGLPHRKHRELPRLIGDPNE